MKKFLLPILMLLAIVGTSKAQTNALSVPDITLPQNSEAKLAVNFQFDADNTYAGYQFELEIASDLEFVTEDEVVSITKGSCHHSGHSVTANLNSKNKVTIGCNYDGHHNLSGTNGMLLTFSVKPSTAVTVGHVYSGSIKVVRLATNAGTSVPLSDGSFTITIGEPVDLRTILDENSTTAPTAATGVDVRVKRTITANHWSTICLPFAMTSAQVKAAFGDDVQLGDFTGYKTTEEGDNIVGITVNFNNVTAIEENHPYIIKVNKDVAEFTVDGVNVNPSEEPTVSFGFTTGKGSKAVYHPIDFNGTYVADFNMISSASSIPLFLSGNKFYYATASSKHMKAFRAYFDFDDYLPEAETGASARIKLSINGDGNTTNIDPRTMQTIESGKVYNMNGQYVGEAEDANSLPKGIYIVNGKKKVIK